MNAKHLRTHVIQPTLTKLGAWSKAAEDLVLGTACQESHCGKYLRQVGCSGTVGAFGVWQMEIATARDIYDNYLRYKPELKAVVDGLRGNKQSIAEALTTNLAYACAMCRVPYLRQPGKIPATVDGQAQYWKKYYNTELGKGTVAEYIDNWERFVNA